MVMRLMVSTPASLKRIDEVRTIWRDDKRAVLAVAVLTFALLPGALRDGLGAIVLRGTDARDQHFRGGTLRHAFSQGRRCPAPHSGHAADGAWASRASHWP